MATYGQLTKLISEMGSALVAYSGGVDSTLLAKAATDALGEKSLCVVIDTCLVPSREVEDAREMADQFGFKLEILPVDVFQNADITDNGIERCYHCKLALFGQLADVARERGLNYVLDGSNASDESDYRPGAKAASELGVRSPFKELGWGKEQIRLVSRDVGLPTWNKPSFACLASRVPYGTKLTQDKLRRIERAESLLMRLGFHQLRVRDHGDLARIEILPNEMERVMQPQIRQQILHEFHEIGYLYVTLDMSGYRTGSMNQSLSI